MAYDEKLRSISVEASGDLSASQFRFMVVDSNGQLAAAGAGAATDGVLQDDPDAAGKAGELGVEGVSKCEAGAAVAAGDLVASDASGKCVTASTGNVVAGRAMSAASADGEIISVLLKDGHVAP